MGCLGLAKGCPSPPCFLGSLLRLSRGGAGWPPRTRPWGCTVEGEMLGTGEAGRAVGGDGPGLGSDWLEGPGQGPRLSWPRRLIHTQRWGGGGDAGSREPRSTRRTRPLHPRSPFSFIPGPGGRHLGAAVSPSSFPDALTWGSLPVGAAVLPRWGGPRPWRRHTLLGEGVLPGPWGPRTHHPSCSHGLWARTLPRGWPAT